MDGFSELGAPKNTKGRLKDGFSELGAMLAGGDRGAQSAAFNEGATGAVRLEALLADARIKQRKDAQQMGINSKLVATGVPQEQADLMTGLMLGNDDSFQGVQSGIQTGQQVRFADEAMSLARGEGGAANLDEINRMLMVLDGKPVDMTKIQDHTFINPMVGPAGQDKDLVTLLGQMEMAHKDSQIQRNQAQGQAALTRANKPTSPRGGGAAKSGNPEDIELANARAALQDGAEPADVAAEMRRRGFGSLVKKIYEAPKAPRTDDDG